MSLSEYYYVSAAVELFAAFVTLTMLLVRFLLKAQLKAEKTAVDTFFVALLSTHALALLVDAPVWLLLAAPSAENVPLVKALSFLSDLFLIASVALYGWCLTAYTASKEPISHRPAWWITGLCGAAIFTCLLSLFNGMYIGYDEGGADVTGPMYWLYLLFTILLPALTALLAFHHRRILGRRDTWVFASYGLIVVASIPLQLFWAITPVYLAADGSILTLSFAVIYTEQARRAADAEKKLVEQDLALSESRNALVLSQIQPHFLYNALTAIYYLCDTKPEAAKTAVSDFSRYLRGNLDSIRKTGLISFSDELRHTQAYLALEKVRYEDELEVCYDIEAAEFLLPPLTIEPLVENAVNHGISSLPSGGRVSIAASELADCFEVCITDNGVGFDPAAVLQKEARSHIGISAVRSRLHILCGGTLDIKSAPGQGTTATIHIPKGENVYADHRR